MKVLMSVAAAALACVAFAEGRGGRMPVPNPAMGEPLVRLVSNPKTAEKVGLSAEQAATIKGIMKEERKIDKALREKMREAMRRQLDLLNADSVDEAALMGSIDELFEARKELAKAQMRKVIKVKEVLTPEQVEKALAEMARVQKERRERRGGPVLRKDPPPPSDED